jgi:hypothetical protein
MHFVTNKIINSTDHSPSWKLTNAQLVKEFPNPVKISLDY